MREDSVRNLRRKSVISKVNEPRDLFSWLMFFRNYQGMIALQKRRFVLSNYVKKHFKSPIAHTVLYCVIRSSFPYICPYQ